MSDWQDQYETLIQPALAKGAACAPLFIGLTAVGFAMEFHATSRPASGADHQIAHMWEMQGHAHDGRKVSHGAAVSVSCITTLMFYDWLLEQDITDLTPEPPDLDAALDLLHRTIEDRHIAERAVTETHAKWPTSEAHAARLHHIKSGWTQTRDKLRAHLYRADEMTDMLRKAGAPALPADIGVSLDYLRHTIQAAAFIRSRYTVFDFLKDLDLFDAAVEAVMDRQARLAQSEAAA